MVGFFDSGVGGLSVLREFSRLLPNEDVVYFGDTAHVPYGLRSVDDIVGLSLQAIEFLISQKSKLVAVACNTATSVAIQEVRKHFPSLPIIGVVPVMKTLAQQTRNKRVAVCATTATLSSNSYAQLKKDFCTGLEVLELARPEWVTFIESGDTNSSKVIELITSTVNDIRDFGADSVALGCTHFDFLRPVLEKAIPEVAIYDSGAAVARHIVRVLTANHALAIGDRRGTEKFFVSGSAEQFSSTASDLLGRTIITKKVRKLTK
jgi:glutamate racemase